MPKKIKIGDKLPFFRYDTPYSRQASFRALLAANAPMVLVFMGNFGHPVTRVFAQRYARSCDALRSGGMALVVRSQAEKLSAAVHEGTLPYELICDVRGVLYEHLQIPQRSGVGAYSMEAWEIMHAARARGYRVHKDSIHQMPLTLALEADGTVLFCHYGTTLTDAPADCTAMQKILEAVPPEDAGDDSDVTVYAGHGVPDIPALADRAVREYGNPDMDKTFVGGLFDDPYKND